MPAASRNHREAVLVGRDNYIQEVGRFRRQALGDGGVEFGALSHAPRLPTEAAGHGHEVGKGSVVAMAVAPAVHHLLPLAHHAHVAVVAQHQLDGKRSANPIFPLNHESANLVSIVSDGANPLLNAGEGAVLQDWWEKG